MALEWLGQLSPTMQQQIALQRALLALQREDEQIRAKTAEKEPALARKLVEGPGPAIPGGPTYAGGLGPGPVGSAFDRPSPSAFTAPSPSAFAEPAPSAFRAGAGSLEEALRAAQPTAGYVSSEERSRLYKEKMAVGKEELAGKASEFWVRIEPLDDEGEKVALDACRKHQPELYRAMIEQGYVDKTTGAAVRTEVVKKPMTRDTHIEDGWLYEDVLYDDGTSTHEIIGRAEEAEAEGATISESIALEKLGMEMGEYAERHRTAAIKVMGDMPRPGIDTVNIEGKDVPATVEHANAWLEGVNALTAYLSAQAGEAPVEGEVSMGDVKSMYEGRPDLISAVQQKLGIPITGVWDEATEFAFTTYGDVLLTEEPVEEGKPKFERQKKFWAKWLKTWGKILRVKGVNIGGLTREEWEAKKGGE